MQYNPTTVEDMTAGPAMRKLTPLQQKWVMAKATNPNWSGRACAKEAGYSGDDNNLRITSWKLKQDKNIRAALREVTLCQLNSMIPMAQNVLEEIVGDPNEKRELRFKAATWLLGIAGVSPETVVRNIHEVELSPRSREDILAAIRSKAAVLGIDPLTLLEDKSKVVDAEFVEVAPEFDPKEWAV